MKHFLLQFKPYCIIAEKQPIPTWRSCIHEQTTIVLHNICTAQYGKYTMTMSIPHGSQIIWPRLCLVHSCNQRQERSSYQWICTFKIDEIHQATKREQYSTSLLIFLCIGHNDKTSPSTNGNTSYLENMPRKTVPKRETGRSALEVPVTHTSAVIFRSYVDSRNDQCNHLSFQGIVTRIFRQLYKIESVWNFHRTGHQVEKLLSTLQNTRGIAIAQDLKLLKSQQRRYLYFRNKMHILRC